MAVIGSLAVRVSASTLELSKGLASAERSILSFGGTMGGLAASAGALAAGFLGIGAAADAMTSGIRGAVEMEQAEISFGVLLKSATEAKRVLADLSQFAAETPFEMPELNSAGRSLAAFGFGSDQIVSTLRRLGDVAAGIGQPIGEIAEIYGKARVQGRLFGEDINQLTGRGIPVIQELAKQFGVSESEVKKLVEQGKIGFAQLEKAFQSMTDEGGTFAGMMEKQSQSLGGLWSSLSDTVSTALREVAARLIETFDVKSIIKSVTDSIASFTNVALKILPALVQIGTAVTAFIGTLLAVVSALRAVSLAQTAWLALSGPIGWKALAAAAAATATALYGVNAVYDDITASATEATQAVEDFADAGDDTEYRAWLEAGYAISAEEAHKRTKAAFEEMKRTQDEAAANAVKTAASIADRIKDLRKEYDLLAASESLKPFVEMQQELDQFKADGANAEQLRALSEELNKRQDLLVLQKQQADQRKKAEEAAKEAESEMDRLRSRGQQLLEAARTPQEQLQSQLAEIRDLYERGILSLEEMNKLQGLEMAKFDEEQATGAAASAVAGPAAQQRGSAEAFSSIFAAMRGEGKPLDMLAKTSQQQLAATKSNGKDSLAALGRIEARLPEFTIAQV